MEHFDPKRYRLYTFNNHIGFSLYCTEIEIEGNGMIYAYDVNHRIIFAASDAVIERIEETFLEPNRKNEVFWKNPKEA